MTSFEGGRSGGTMAALGEGSALPASASRSCAGPRAVTRRPRPFRSCRRARNAQRRIPHPLGRARRALPQHRRQALPPSRGWRAQPELQPAGPRRRPRTDDLHLRSRARFALRRGAHAPRQLQHRLSRVLRRARTMRNKAARPAIWSGPERQAVRRWEGLSRSQQGSKVVRKVRKLSG